MGISGNIPRPKVPGHEVERRSNPESTPIFGGSRHCPHEFIMIKWSGYECNSCQGWYCD